MTELCKKFEQIISSYQAEEYGKESLYLNEILEKAGEPDLIRLMNENELKYLLERKLFSKMMYSCALEALKIFREKAKEETAEFIVSTNDSDSSMKTAEFVLASHKQYTPSTYCRYFGNTYDNYKEAG